MTKTLAEIRNEIIDDPMNADMKAKGYVPLYTADAQAKIVIIGQAPGHRAQESGVPWGDASGKTLREWMGVTDEQFYDPKLVALIPMDFYYPGKGTHGDLPPRKEFASRWHAQILAHMPQVELTVLIGAYAQKQYLGTRAGRTLTNTVRNYAEYLPEYFPLVHPSPLNFRWQAKNPWFATEVVPALQREVARVVSRFGS